MPVMTLLDKRIRDYETKYGCTLEILSQGASGGRWGTGSIAVAFKNERSNIAKEIRRLGETTNAWGDLGTYYIPGAFIITGAKRNRQGTFFDYAIVREADK